jgi:RNA polymerase sigma factor (sigma-70 family)
LRQEQRKQLVEGWHEQWHQLVLQILAKCLPVKADVQDLAQEIYLRLLRVDRLDMVENPRAYLYRVAVNIADEWRLRAQRMPTTSIDNLPADAVTAPEDLESWLQRRQNRDLIRNALMELPLAYRTALVLHVHRKLTYAEIARHMGVTHRMVKRYLAKAHVKMRRHMLDIGISQSVGKAGEDR